LYHIFLEYSFLAESPQIRDGYQKYIHLCRKNFETVLATLTLLMPARPESIEALTLGVGYSLLPFSTNSTNRSFS
jgi:hypothetical protein